MAPASLTTNDVRNTNMNDDCKVDKIVETRLNAYEYGFKSAMEVVRIHLLGRHFEEYASPEELRKDLIDEMAKTLAVTMERWWASEKDWAQQLRVLQTQYKQKVYDSAEYYRDQFRKLDERYFKTLCKFADGKVGNPNKPTATHWND